MRILTLYTDDKALHKKLIKLRLFRVTGPLCGEFNGHR